MKSKKNVNVHNLPTEQKNALDNRMTDREIVIWKADKGGAITLLNKEDHKQVILTQLNNNKFYKKLDYEPKTVHIQELRTLNNAIQRHISCLLFQHVPNQKLFILFK